MPIIEEIKNMMTLSLEIKNILENNFKEDKNIEILNIINQHLATKSEMINDKINKIEDFEQAKELKKTTINVHINPAIATKEQKLKNLKLNDQTCKDIKTSNDKEIKKYDSEIKEKENEKINNVIKKQIEKEQKEIDLLVAEQEKETAIELILADYNNETLKRRRTNIIENKKQTIELNNELIKKLEQLKQEKNDDNNQKTEQMIENEKKEKISMKN